MILQVLHYPDPLLKKKSEPITEITPAIKQLAADMAETMYAEDGIGLAAPQIGQLVRMVVIDLSGPSERTNMRVYVNPVIEALSDEMEPGEEGCLSVPGLRSDVKRYTRIRMNATDLEGKPIVEEAEGLMAICMQHECDHLDGVLFIDHISRLKKNLYDRKLKKRAALEKE